MADDPRSFGRWLKQQRLVYDLSQERLAERLGCAPSTLQKIEQGVRRPSRILAARIFTALDISESAQRSLLQLARSAGAPTDTGRMHIAPGLLEAVMHFQS